MNDIYTRLVSSAIFPLQERLKRYTTVAVRRAREGSQWWSAERLREVQSLRLRNLLSDVDAHVPYYRAILREIGLSVEDVKSAAEIRCLPLLTKALIRANTPQLRAVDADGLARFNTGGSYGEPLIFLIGRERISHDVAAKWRATRWWHVDIGDREVVVWGWPIDMGAQDRVRLLRDRVMRTVLLAGFEMSAPKVDAFIARVRRFRPPMLFGYPSSLFLIARHAEKRHVRMDDLPVKVVFVTTERLYDDQREPTGRVFGCRFANG